MPHRQAARKATSRSQHREGEAQGEAKECAPEDLHEVQVRGVIEHAQVALLQEALDRPGVDPIVDKRRVLERVKQGRRRGPDQEDPKAIYDAATISSEGEKFGAGG